VKEITLSANSSWYLYNMRSSSIVEAIKNGYSVTCISPKDKYTNHLIRLGCKHHPINFSSKTINPISEFILVIKFFFAYLKIKPIAAFHFTVKNNIYGTIAAALLGIPAVNNISGLGTAFIKKSMLSSLVLFLYRISQYHAFKIFCQNEEDVKLLVENKAIHPDKIILIPGSGVDTNRFHPRLKEERKPSFFQKKEFTFLYAGRMLYDKGLNELLEAFQAMCLNGSQSKLELSGFLDTDNSSAVSEKQIQSWLKIPNVVWHGHSDNIENIMSKVDCVVLPSYREGMPKTLLEAGSIGLPVIATDVPGCKNIIINGFNGYLCKPYSSHSLQQSMEKMSQLDKKELKIMGDNARSIVLKRFDESIVIKKFFKVLDQLQ
jgi:glycosyltransferase involved in cell wall biosynthesis